jgi:hypothetical protein
LQNTWWFGEYFATTAPQFCLPNHTPRHPSIFQIYGVASSGGIYVTLFHGGEVSDHNMSYHQILTPKLDLIPFKEFVNLYRHSHVSTVYIYACCVRASVPQFYRILICLKETEFSVRTFNAVVHPSYTGVAGCKWLCLFSITKGTREFNHLLPDLPMNWSSARGNAPFGYVAQLGGSAWISLNRLTPTFIPFGGRDPPSWDMCGVYH